MIDEPVFRVMLRFISDDRCAGWRMIDALEGGGMIPYIRVLRNIFFGWNVASDGGVSKDGKPAR